MSLKYIHTADFDLKGKDLIVPVVSTANIGQLAVDILIATFGLERVGILDPRYCVPVVGAREGGKPGITTPLEIYGRKDLSFVALQQRSPPLRSKKQEFVDGLLEFIRVQQFSAVLLLSGVEPTNRSDLQMMTPTYKIIPPNSAPLASTRLASLTTLPIPDYTTPPPSDPLREGQQQKEDDIPLISGGGITRRILSSYTSLSASSKLQAPITALVQFVVEGDNRFDASLLASVVSKVLDISTAELEWKQPASWDQGLFGTPQEATIYG